MLHELQNSVSSGEPDLQIGSLFFWISGYTNINQIDQGDMAYLKNPTLLKTKNVIIFS